VAIGSSGSFPALTIASLAAAEAMNVEAVTILSLGASGYGATRPELHLLNIMEVLLREGVLKTQPAAVSLGGERDTGRDYSPQLREILLKQISKSGIPLIDEPDLRLNVAARMALYGADPGHSPISAFINAGGSFANLGTSNLVLKLRPGLNRSVALPPRRERGVLFEMAARDIPIIHLLYIDGLARQQNLPWDPSPLPGSGDWNPPVDASRRGPWFWWIAASHFAVVLLIVLQSLRFFTRREL
jgi:poly-gamma-glutamate system protein